MAPKAHIFSLFFLALALSASCAEAAPQASRMPTKSVEENLFLDPRPEVAPNDDRSHNTVVCNGLKDNAADCVGQKDSFERMAQAYSYLGHYMRTQSLYGAAMQPGSKVLQDSQKAVLDCVNGGNCTAQKQAMMVAALIQYNLGKSVKSMILQNNTNRENMKSVDLPPGTRSVSSKKAQSSDTFTESFKLTPQDLNAAENFSPKNVAALNDMSKLGEEFKKEYVKFIDTYSNSSGKLPGTRPDMAGKEKWNYQHQKGRASDSHHTWVIDPVTNNPKMVTKRQRYDEDTQNSQVVQDAVKNFKEGLTAPKFSLAKEEDPKTAGAKPGDKKNTTAGSRVPGAAKKGPPPGSVVVEDVNGLKFGDLGFGVREFKDKDTGRLFNDKEAAAEVAGRINKQIDAASKHQRDIAAKSGKPISAVNVQINIDDFDAYLNRIWPPSAIKTKIPSQNK